MEHGEGDHVAVEAPDHLEHLGLLRVPSGLGLGLKSGAHGVRQLGQVPLGERGALGRRTVADPLKVPEVPKVMLGNSCNNLPRKLLVILRVSGRAVASIRGLSPSGFMQG